MNRFWDELKTPTRSNQLPGIGNPWESYHFLPDIMMDLLKMNKLNFNLGKAEKCPCHFYGVADGDEDDDNLNIS
jgi:hypothetical protein